MEARWPEGSRCPCCGGTAHSVLRVKGRKTLSLQPLPSSDLHHRRYPLGGHQAYANGMVPGHVLHQPSEDRNLGPAPVTCLWGISYPTTWLMHHQLMQAMLEREAGYQPTGRVQRDEACLGGEHTGGSVGHGSENKVPFLAAVSVDEQGHPMRAKFAQLTGASGRR